MREEIEDQHSFLDANKRFHDIIAWSSGNALFGYIIDSLSGIMDGTAIGIDYPSHRRQAILKAHVEIFDALQARDPKGSEARMREHIDAYERYAARKFPQVLKETIPWEQRYFA
jgi:DNA-binding FadR family transcriptional regulator